MYNVQPQYPFLLYYGVTCYSLCCSDLSVDEARLLPSVSKIPYHQREPIGRNGGTSSTHRDQFHKAICVTSYTSTYSTMGKEKGKNVSVEAVLCLNAALIN